MLKLCENGSNIDYLYETSSVLRKATETEISGLTFWLRFGFLKTQTEPKFGFRTSLIIIQPYCPAPAPDLPVLSGGLGNDRLTEQCVKHAAVNTGQRVDE